MTQRDYDAEIAATADQIKQLDDASRDCMLLETQLEADLVQLKKDLATPATALDRKAFAKVNETIERTHVKLSTAKRSFGAIGDARGKLDELRKHTINAKHMAQASEYGRSAVEMAKSIDEGPLSEFREMLGHLLNYVNATNVAANQAGGRLPDAKVKLACTLAEIFREAGLDIRVGEAIRTSYSSTAGYQTFAEALAEFASAVETTR